LLIGLMQYSSTTTPQENIDDDAAETTTNITQAGRRGINFILVEHYPGRQREATTARLYNFVCAGVCSEW